MTMKGPRVLNWRRAAAKGTAAASRRPRKGIRFRNPLTIPIVTAPFIPRTKNTTDVPAAMMDPTIRFPSTNPRIILPRFLTNLGTSILSWNMLVRRTDIRSFPANMKNTRKGSTPAMIRTPDIDPTPRTRKLGQFIGTALIVTSVACFGPSTNGVMDWAFFSKRSNLPTRGAMVR